MSPSSHRQLRQGKPFVNLEEEVFRNVLQAGDALLQGEVEVLRRAELTFPQYNVLRILRGAGAVGASCGQIGERMVNRDPDLTRLLDRLEARGLVRRTRGPDDRRVVIAAITDEGLAVLESLDAPVARVHRERLRHMSREQLETLAELLALARAQPR